MSDRLSIAAIKMRLLERIGEVVARLVPRATRHHGYWQGPNPTRAKDGKSSFTVWRNGAWKEFDSGEKGDIIDLIAYSRRCERADAIVWAKDFLGIRDMPPEERARLDRLAAEKIEQQRKAAAADAERKRKRAFEIWLRAGGIRPDGPVTRYLRHWRIDLSAVSGLTGDLREAPALDYFGPRPAAAEPRWRYHGPALVAPIRHLKDPGFGAIMGVQALFVQEDSDKLAPLPAPKCMIGAKKGGAVWISNGPSGLTPPQRLERWRATGEQEDLLVTEGVKTGLAGALVLAELRCWALLDLGNIGAVPFLPWVRRLVVAIENDIKPAALEQREKTLDALRDRGFEVLELVPPVGSDLADTLRGD